MDIDALDPICPLKEVPLRPQAIWISVQTVNTVSPDIDGSLCTAKLPPMIHSP